MSAPGAGVRRRRHQGAGCASGEEAYSLVIAFSEALGVEETAKRVKIYGTDIDDEELRSTNEELETTNEEL